MVDTVAGPWDPNAIYVTPEGCVTPGTNLNYKITFENLGNAPAVNVYVLDTLPPGLDINSLELISSSHEMFISTAPQLKILRFDFPNIMLADSSDHLGRHGMFQYKINSKSNWPIGASIDHRVGIYFDHNEVVLTNYAQTGMCWPAAVSEIPEVDIFTVYPNPAGDEISVNTRSVAAYHISNTFGQSLQSGSMTAGRNTLNVRNLPAGIYHLQLETADGVQVKRFQKL
ncbi:MAG: T9SS type A sorting domain-containing protein [Flavipsychrobacter sp.]|nr:T9SS type A sorting domain-containing protein [Flavipsychrobacter sp.]